MHPMSLFDYKYRGDADESTGVDTGANAGAVSDDPTEPAALIETALTDPTDGSSDTDASGCLGDKEQPEIVIHLHSTLEELFAPNDWGDVLRLVNFKWDESRVTPDREGQWRLLLHNRSTGMWRMQGNSDFQPLFDLMLSEANEDGLEFAESEPTTSDLVRGRLRRHIEGSSGGSVSKAVRRSARLADDPCVPIHRVDPSSVNRVERYPVILCEDNTVSLTDGVVVDRADLQRHFLLDMAPCPDRIRGGRHRQRGARGGDDEALPAVLGQWRRNDSVPTAGLAIVRPPPDHRRHSRRLRWTIPARKSVTRHSGSQRRAGFVHGPGRSDDTPHC